MFWDVSEIIDFIAIRNEINDFSGSQKHTKNNYVIVLKCFWKVWKHVALKP